jgi:AcrR family transcriptional regulator
VNVPVASAKIASTRRMLDAARTIVAQGGAAALSTGDVAIAAGVSKALVHYHFRDKETLLAQLARHVGDAVVAREGDVVLRTDAPRPLDAYWEWVHAELDAGDVRVLLALTPGASDIVSAALDDVLARRRMMATRHVDGVFAHFGFRPHVPPAVLGDAMVALLDGLAASSALLPAQNARATFDAIWLGLLTLVDND